MSYNAVALITGAGKGIGEALAFALASQGYNLMLTARTQSDLERVQQTILSKHPHSSIRIFAADVADAKQVDALTQATMAAFGRVDVLINNAGICPPFRLFQEISLELLEQTLDINLKGPLFLTHNLLPQMIHQGGGTIININSTAGKIAYPFSAVYCASKFGLKAFSDCLGQEQRQNNIKVVNIHPGEVNTPLWNDIEPDVVQDEHKMLRPDDVAQAVTYVLQQHANNWVQDITLIPLAGQPH